MRLAIPPCGIGWIWFERAELRYPSKFTTPSYVVPSRSSRSIYRRNTSDLLTRDKLAGARPKRTRTSTWGMRRRLSELDRVSRIGQLRNDFPMINGMTAPEKRWSSSSKHPCASQSNQTSSLVLHLAYSESMQSVSHQHNKVFMKFNSAIKQRVSIKGTHYINIADECRGLLVALSLNKWNFTGPNNECPSKDPRKKKREKRRKSVTSYWIHRQTNKVIDFLRNQGASSLSTRDYFRTRFCSSLDEKTRLRELRASFKHFLRGGNSTSFDSFLAAPSVFASLIRLSKAWSAGSFLRPILLNIWTCVAKFPGCRISVFFWAFRRALNSWALKL